jgi:hypothetical protein
MYWKVNLTFSFRKTVRDFGHLFQTFQIIHCTGLVLQNDLMLRFTKFKSWQHFYLTKHTNIDTETMEEITNEYRHAKKMLALFRDDFNSSILIEVASKMLWILGKITIITIQSSFFFFLSHLYPDFYPYHAGCYYILSLLLFMIHQHEEALDIIDLGREMNPTFHRFNGKMTSPF